MGELSLQESQQVHMVKMSSKPWKGKEVSDYYKIHPKSLPSYRPVLQRKKKKTKNYQDLIPAGGRAFLSIKPPKISVSHLRGGNLVRRV